MKAESHLLTYTNFTFAKPTQTMQGHTLDKIANEFYTKGKLWNTIQQDMLLIFVLSANIAIN